MPYEIEQNISNYDNVNVTQNIYFIGMGIYETNLVIDSFCKNNNLKYVQIGGFSNNVDTKTNQQYISESIIAPAIQGDKWQVDVGYVPCRIFKNLSYGHIPATNSIYVRDFFGENSLPYASDCYDLFKVNEDFINSDENLENSKFLLSEIKNNHTYLTRVNSLLNFVQ